MLRIDGERRIGIKKVDLREVVTGQNFCWAEEDYSKPLWWTSDNKGKKARQRAGFGLFLIANATCLPKTRQMLIHHYDLMIHIRPALADVSSR